MPSTSAHSHTHTHSRKYAHMCVWREARLDRQQQCVYFIFSNYSRRMQFPLHHIEISQYLSCTREQNSPSEGVNSWELQTVILLLEYMGQTKTATTTATTTTTPAPALALAMPMPMPMPLTMPTFSSSASRRQRQLRRRWRRCWRAEFHTQPA